MKLYLSSYLIPDVDSLSNFVGKKPSDIKMGLVLNAKDDKPIEERRIKKQELLNYYLDLGFQVETIDLLDFVGNNDPTKKLKEFDVVWLNGGNTFCLRWAVEQSNCIKALNKALNAGVVYGGDSAGAIITGPTLKYFDMADNPSAVREIIYEGLNFVDFCVLPHWGSEKYGKILKGIEGNLQKDGYKTVRLKDDEFLLVENGKIIN